MENYKQFTKMSGVCNGMFGTIALNNRFDFYQTFHLMIPGLCQIPQCNCLSESSITFDNND